MWWWVASEFHQYGDHHRVHAGGFSLWDDYGEDSGAQEGRAVSAANIFDIFGGILTIALVATILTKPNTAADVKAAGSAFTGSLTAAEAG